MDAVAGPYSYSTARPQGSVNNQRLTNEKFAQTYVPFDMCAGFRQRAVGNGGRCWDKRYDNFSVAIYIAVNTTRQLSDPQTLEQQYERISSQLEFDKVYLEVYRDHEFADERGVVAIKQFFAAKGIEVSAGVTLAAGGEAGSSARSTTKARGSRRMPPRRGAGRTSFR